MYPKTNDHDAKVEAEGRAEGDRVLRLFHGTMTCSPLPFVAVEGQQHTVRYVNPAFCDLVDKAAEKLLGCAFAEAVPEREANGYIALLDRVYRTGVAETLADQEHTPAALPGVYWSYVAWAVQAAHDHPGQVIVQVTDTTVIALFRRHMALVNEELLLSNVRQHERILEAEVINVRLQALATTDGLTGLNNHRSFQELLLKEVERSRRHDAPLSLLLLDVDEFKSHNDAYGHPSGDDVLCQIGAVLLATARSNDLVARYGGEEFAVILIGTDAESARAAAERFRVAIEGAAWQMHPITISVGAATLAHTERDSIALIAGADAALYRSKAHGRNCVTHVADVVPAAKTKALLANEPGECAVLCDAVLIAERSPPQVD